MKKGIVLSSVFLIFMSGVMSQTLETGLFIGSSYYLGDINPGRHFDQSLFAGGAVVRYNKNNRLALRLNLLLGQVQAADGLRKAVDNRNLAFTSNITEFSAIAEFNFLPYETGNKDQRYTPFIFAGIGMFFFQPKIGDYRLRDYGTEGQNVGYMDRSPYQTRGISIPFGIGFKYSLTEKIAIAAEWGMRKTFTDYIDDVSTTYYLNASSYTNPDINVRLSDPTLNHMPDMQRGNPETKDWYNFFGLSLTYKIDIGKAGCELY